MKANAPPLDALPGLPCDTDGPVFEAPWQAQVFAMTLSLHARGVFTWSEWSTALSEEIRAAQQAGDPDNGDTYYLHWMKALEAMVARKGVTSTLELARYELAWHRAAARTAHGASIILRDADLDW